MCSPADAEREACYLRRPLRRLRLPKRATQLHLAVFTQQLVSLLDADYRWLNRWKPWRNATRIPGHNIRSNASSVRLYEGQTLATSALGASGSVSTLYVASSVRASARAPARGTDTLHRYAEQADACARPW